MKRSVTVLLATAMLLSVASCTATNTKVTEETSAVTETTTTTTEATTTPETSETEELSLVTSGYLEGLKIEDNNCFLTTNSKYEKLADYVYKTAISSKFQGSIILATDDEILFYGGPNDKTIEGKPVDPFTTYNIASCSKTLTACCVFKLIEEGKMSLDDPLVKYFPKYKAAKDVTISDMLHMVSGVPDYLNEPDKFWPDLNGREELEPMLIKVVQDTYSDEEFLEMLYDAPLMFEPKSKWSYSNTNYHLLAMIVEQVSGMSFCDYLQENIFDKCGMDHASSMKTGDETSVPYKFDELYKAGYVNSDGYSVGPRQERGDGGIHCGMADLLAFDRALVAGNIVSEGSLAEMKNWTDNYGCALQRFTETGYGHTGSIYCYITFNGAFETEEYGRVYLILSTAGAEDMTQQKAFSAITTLFMNKFK